MAIQIRTANALVEVDTIAEFRLVMKVMQEMNGQKKPERSCSLEMFFCNLVSPQQIEALKLLRQRIEGMTDHDLRTSLGLKNNNQLAGVMSGMVRNAQKHGFNYEDIIIKEERIDDSGKKGYTFKLTDAMKEVVPGALI